MTEFKPKVCPKCKRNHQEPEGVLCEFCRQDAERKLLQIRPVPKNYFVQCLIQREGDTPVSIGGIRYIFKKNKRGDSVCEIINPGHYNKLITWPSYTPYEPEEDEAGDEAEAQVEESLEEQESGQDELPVEEQVPVETMPLFEKKVKK